MPDRGLFYRTGEVVGWMLVLLMLTAACNAFWLQWVSTKVVLAMFLIAFIPMLVGMFLSELPRGDDFVLLRLVMSMACRTGVPLVVVLALVGLVPDSVPDAAYWFLVFYYFVGFFASLWVVVRHLSDSEKVVEVERGVY